MTADFTLTGSPDRMTARLSGSWVRDQAAPAGAALRQALGSARRVALDLNGVERLDTAGALAVLEATGGRVDREAVTGPPEISRLLALVEGAASHRTPPVRRPHDLHALVIAVGRGAVGLWQEGRATLAFIGHVAIDLALHLTRPSRIRWPALVNQVQRAGIDAIPIVGVTSFFIGAVVALLGIHMLRTFGAQVYVVELVGVGVLREFGVLITAILLAGRSASAFAAELGAMRMQQEVDALEVMSVDPTEALVLPRLGALLITMPLLTFVAVITGIIGGLLVTWASLDLAPGFFLQRIVDSVGVRHLWIGMSKTPLMAAVIAGIGCRQGMLVGGDVQSLGRRVTAAVVHAIFAIIMLDAAFALVFMELDL